MLAFFLCLVFLSATSFSEGRTSKDVGKEHQLEEKIVGGVEAAQNEFPFLVEIYRRNTSTGYRQQWCGGTIINKWFILTAAHCIYHVPPGTRIEVKVGEHSIQNYDEGEVSIFSTSTTIHPSYNDNTYENDVALIKLASPITFVKGVVEAIQLNEASAAEKGRMIVAGWGHTKENGTFSDILLKVTVFKISSAYCASVYGTINRSQICAAAPGKDSCQGDSGGPLFKAYNGAMVQIGVVSSGGGCASPGVPGVYARVSYYAPWIKANSGM